MKISTIQMISDYTGGSFDIWRMAGPANRFRRQAVMSALMGKKATIAQSGVNAILNTLLTLYQAETGPGCFAVRERKLAETLRGILAAGKSAA